MTSVRTEKNNLNQEIVNNNQADTEGFELFYRNHMMLLRDLEVINPQNLLTPLYKYLSIMISEEGNTVIDRLADDVQEEASWLNQAQKICHLQDIMSEIETQISHFQEGDFRRVLLADCLNQVKFYQERFDNNLLEEISQLHNAVITCLDTEKLAQYKEEIVNYLEEHKVKPLTRSVQETMDRLKQSSIINLLKSRGQQFKKIHIQADLMTTKFIRFANNFMTNARFGINDLVALKNEISSCDNMLQLSSFEQKLRSEGMTDLNQMRQQLLQFETFKSFCRTYIDKFKQYQAQANQILPEKVAARINAQLNAVITTTDLSDNTDPIQQISDLKSWENYYYEILDSLPEQRKLIEKLNADKTAKHMQLQFESLEKAISNSQKLIEDATEVLTDVKIRLSCAALAKQCYPGFSLSLIFKYVTKRLTALKQSILNTESILDREIDWNAIDYPKAKIAMVQSQKESMLATLHNELNNVDDYLMTIKIDEEQFQEAMKIKWQVQLSKSLLKANSANLDHYYEQLCRIERISNVYVRALFIIFFSRVEGKLSDRMVDQIQSWRLRNVSEETVVKTMRYFNIAISDNTLLRIAPHIKHYREILNSDNKACFTAICTGFLHNVFGVFDVFKKAS